MHVKDLNVYHVAEPFPISKKEHGADFLLNNRHLWLRSRLQIAIMRVRNEIIKSIRDFFYDNDFVLMDSPILTGSIGETASTLFETEYFDQGKAYLAQTGQLYLETSIFALAKTFCFGPTFRAEKSHTRRHLTEFWMVEGEMAFYDNEKNMQVQEQLVSYVVERVLERCKEPLKELERDTSILEKIPGTFERMSYDDAIKFLQEKK